MSLRADVFQIIKFHSIIGSVLMICILSLPSALAYSYFEKQCDILKLTTRLDYRVVWCNLNSYV
jgi:hypothetical protein